MKGFAAMCKRVLACWLGIVMFVAIDMKAELAWGRCWKM